MAWSEDLTRWYHASGNMLLDIGATDAAIDHFDIANYFADATLLYVSDYNSAGC